MKTHLLFFLLRLLFQYAACDSDVGIGYQVTLAIPPAYSSGFVGRAFLMETDQQPEPYFRTALTVEALDDDDDADDHYYSCSLDIFLGKVRVWSSGHFSRFYTSDKCSLELTLLGDLQLKGQKDRIGWRSGTSGQGVQRLYLLRSGNLVLVDSLNSIKWQTFNFPTDIMLWGQRLSSRTRLTSFVSNSRNTSTGLFYTLEVQYDKIALFLNSGNLKYSYWEFRPPVGENNITYVELTSNALEIYNGNFQKVAQIPPPQQQQHLEPLRFLTLENATGNLGLYYYSAQKSGFQASYQALNRTCDLPLTCDPYGICTFSQTCSCISLVTRAGGPGEISTSSGCSSNISGDVCEGHDEARKMVELQGVTSVLRGMAVEEANMKKERCENLCLENCTCVAALYRGNEEEGDSCYLYGLVRGIKQVDRSSLPMTRETYMVKVPKGSDENRVRERNSGLKRWVVILIGVGDGLLILIVVGGIAYYFFRKTRNNSFQDTAQHNTTN